MKKIIRLTESDLTRIVKRVIREQNEGEPDPKGPDESGQDRDWWGLDLAPKLIRRGFVTKTDPSPSDETCPYKCCTYMYKGSHNGGTNVYLDCGEGNTGVWEIVVYKKGDSDMKRYPAGQSGAKQAVEYAISLG